VRRTTRQAAATLTLAACVLCTSCAALPELPEPMPSALTTIRPTPTLDTEGTELSPDGFDVVQRMAVRVRNVGCENLSTGSGFAIDEHTLITNRHVVAGSESLEVSTYDGRDVDVAAASAAALADLAVVRTEDPLPSFPRIADGDPREGDRVTR
jgi:S1-C subfamily serine protease